MYIFTGTPPTGGSGSVVAFAAYHNNSRTYYEEETLIFDQVITNLENYYNPVTGVFTCIEAGVYQFSLSITHDTYQMVADIEKSGTAIATAYGFFGHTYDQGSITVTVECSIGESVYAVSKAYGGTLAGVGDDFRLWSMFSGHKVN